MAAAVQNIPKSLIYEMVNGKPIYYKGYQDYLSGEKKVEAIMPSSYLQAILVTELVIWLSKHLDTQQYQLISSEVGLQFSKKSWRAADIAIYEKTQLKNTAKQNKYLTIPPRVVIEVDTKAALEDVANPLNYYQEKTNELLEFGVESVIWIFTDTQKVLIANAGKDWSIINWSKDFILFEEVSLNIQKIIDKI
jgi:Uma2 family endonuclease